MSSLSLYWTGRLEWTSWAQLALSVRVRLIRSLSVKASAAHALLFVFVANAMQMFSQVSYMAVPSYNFPLGFWGCYCSYSKNGRAVFAYLVFLVLSILVDIIWMGEWGGGNGQVYNFFQCGTTGDVLTVGGHVCHTNQFALVMLIFNMLTKVSYANNTQAAPMLNKNLPVTSATNAARRYIFHVPALRGAWGGAQHEGHSCHKRVCEP